MRHLAFAVLLVLSACTTAAEPPDLITPPSSELATTSSTISSTTPTTASLVLEGNLVDAELGRLVETLYRFPGGGEPPEASAEVLAALTGLGVTTSPLEAVGHVALIGEDRVAVIEAGSDVTLAVADPSWRVVGGWWPSLGVDQVLGTFPKIVAVVGSDARPGEDPERSRADSIHFVGLDGSGGAAVVGVPRDSWVSLPGLGRGKINSSLSRGGPELMMATFSELTGLSFDGYLLTGFEGFQELITALGGLDVEVPTDLNDKDAKAFISAGRQILDAADALAFTRVRKTLPRGDFDRQENGGRAIIAAASMVETMGIGSIPELLAASRDPLFTDLTTTELLLLAAAVTRVDPLEVANVVVPGRIGSAGNASVVFLSDDASATFTDLEDGVLDER